MPSKPSAKNRNWREEVRVCPVCRENYWPAAKSTKARWDARSFCTQACRNKALRMSSPVTRRFALATASAKPLLCDYCGAVGHDESAVSCPKRKQNAQRFQRRARDTRRRLGPLPE